MNFLPLPRWLARCWLCWKWSREQRSLREHLLERDDFGWNLDEASSEKRGLRFVGGMDISFFVDPQSPEDPRAFAALVVCELDRESGGLEVVWERYDLVELKEEYISGFLAFREVKHLRALVDRLRVERPDLMPDVILVDGNGVLHPRGFGSASHIGVVCDLCTVGVGKDLHVVDGLNRETVKRQLEGVGQGGHLELVGDSGRVWGAALLPLPLRPVGVKGQAPPKNPIYVSVGHRISLGTSIALVKRLCISARVPEPVRLADLRSRERVREAKEKERGGNISKGAAKQKKKKMDVSEEAPPEPPRGGPSKERESINASGPSAAPLVLLVGGLAVATCAVLLVRAARRRSS